MRQWQTSAFAIYNAKGEVEKTHILLTASDGANLPVTVLGDHVRAGRGELMELAKEQFYKEEYGERAMSEAVQKVDEQEAIIKELKTAKADADKLLVELKTAMGHLRGILVKHVPLEEKDVATIIEDFDYWEADKSYQAGQQVSFARQVYEVRQDHTTTKDDTPDKRDDLYKPLIQTKEASSQLVADEAKKEDDKRQDADKNKDKDKK